MQVYPAEARDRQDLRGQQRAIGHDRAAVGLEFAQPLRELRISGARRAEDGYASRIGKHCYRTALDSTAATSGGVRPRHDRDNLVAGFNERLKGRDRYPGRTSEDTAHPQPYSQREEMECGLT